MIPFNNSIQAFLSLLDSTFTIPRGLPPIKVYLVADLYFVLDGHHRVSVARQRGWTHIEAIVYEICSQVSLESDTGADHLAASLASASLLERTRLDQSHPEADLRVSAPGRVATLEAEIEAHRRFMTHVEKRQVQAPEATSAWYEDVYRPAVQMIRNQEMPRRFPGQTEADVRVPRTIDGVVVLNDGGQRNQPQPAGIDISQVTAADAQPVG